MGFKMFLFISVLSLPSACTSNEASFKDQVEVDELGPGESGKLGHETYITENGLSGDSHSSLEWIICKKNQNLPTFVILNPPEKAFSAEGGCQESLFGPFLDANFNILAINRPGYGKSTGQEAFGDDKTLVSTTQALNDLRTKQSLEVQGLWAYGEASILGFRLAKKQNFTYLIVGDGFYDWERTLKESEDEKWTHMLKEAVEIEGKDFAEKRSIAWDFEGLPSHVYLYHSHGNKKVPERHAQDFKNALATAGHKSSFIEVTLGPGLSEPYLYTKATKQILGSMVSRTP